MLVVGNKGSGFRCKGEVWTKIVKIGSSFFLDRALKFTQKIEYNSNKCIKSVYIAFHHFQCSPCHIIYSDLHYKPRKY